MISLIHEDLHLSETQVGLLIGLPLAVFALAAVPGSLLIARIGTRPALILGMTIAAIAGGARGLAIDVWTLYAAAIVTGFGIAIMQPGIPTLVREWLPHRISLGRRCLQRHGDRRDPAADPDVFAGAAVCRRLLAV